MSIKNGSNTGGGGSGSAITALTGDVTASGPGSAVATVAATIPRLASANIFTANQEISDAEPRFMLNETDQGTDLKLWDVDLQAGVFGFRTRTDADGAGVTWLSATRGATTAVTSLTVGSSVQFQVQPGTTALPGISGVGANNASGLIIGSALINVSVGSGVRLAIGTTNIQANQNFIFATAHADASFVRITPTTGFTQAYANNTSMLVIDPAGTLAAGTVQLPTTPINGQLCKFMSTQIITTLSVTSSQTITGAPTTATANQAFEWIYVLANTTWYRTL